MTYAIGEGEHRCHPRPITLHLGAYPVRWDWRVSFGPGCNYEMAGADRWDYNKLVGVSCGLHHRNSFRFGWRCIDARIELAPYVWNGGKRLESEPMFRTDLGEELQLSISIERHVAHFTVSSQNTSAYRAVRLDRRLGALRWGYGLHPYFGGNRTAPNAMVINLEPCK